MGKFDGILICSDFDNTICYENVVSKENAEAIEYFMSEGGLFTLATGRQENHLKNLNINFRCNAPWILINGTLALYDGKIIYENPMSEESLNDVLEILKKYPMMDECHLRTFNDSTVYKNINGKMELVKSAEGKYYKYIFLFKENEDCSRFMEIMKNEYGNKYEFDRSWPFEAEMHTKGSGKGDAVRFLRGYLGEKVKKVICIGDYENDISMILEADVGIAVSNAMESVKEAADIVTVSCRENAMAKIIYSL